MELHTVYGQRILYDKEAEKPLLELFLRIDGALYDMRHITSVPPTPEKIVEVFIEDTWEPTHRVMATPMGVDTKMHINLPEKQHENHIVNV